MVSRYDISAADDILDEQLTFLNPGLKGDYTITNYMEDSTTGNAIGRLQPISPIVHGTSDGKTPIITKLYMRNYSVGLVVVEFK